MDNGSGDSGNHSLSHDESFGTNFKEEYTLHTKDWWRIVIIVELVVKERTLIGRKNEHDVEQAKINRNRCKRLALYI